MDSSRHRRPQFKEILGFHSVADEAKLLSNTSPNLLKIGWTIDQISELHKIFLNTEAFVQLSRLIAGQKELKGFAVQTVAEDFTRYDSV